MKKFILISLFFILTVTSILSAENIGNDTVNIRKLFFLNETNWDSYLGKKSSFLDNKFALISIDLPPKFIDKTVFENDIILNITNEKEKTFIKSSYKLNEVTDRYQLNQNLSNKLLNNLKNILKNINFTDFDYFMIFYKKIPELEKKTVGIDENFSETFTYGKISYLFNKKRDLLEVKLYYQENNNSFLYFDNTKINTFDVYLFGKIYKKGLNYNLK
ncbi:MAG TPA: hypothetical protein PK771_06310, partial [Spirochaetota bacterium]|nr:hypothetical protein [Spirochaetota bacterium]